MAEDVESILEQLPRALLQSVIGRLDAPSICATAACCRVLRACAEDALRELEAIALVDNWRTEAAVVERLLSGNTRLSSLSLDCSKMDDAVINTITRQELHTLCLWGCHQFSAKLLCGIAMRCPELKVLELELGWADDRQEVNSFSTALEMVMQRCRKLETLTVRSESSCFDSGAYAAIPRLVASGLKVLDIGFIPERDAKQVLNLADEFRFAPRASHPFSSLEKLTLVLDRITDSLVGLIATRLPGLLELDLRDGPFEEPLQAFDLTNWGIQQVGACAKLRRLSLVRSQDWSQNVSFKRVSDLGILLMADLCPNLESIKFGGFSRITDVGCRAVLHSCLHLHTFELSNTPQLTDLAFHDLSASPLGLECVTLASCGLLSDFSIQRLACCTRLKSLNLKGCKSVGDGSMKAVASLSKLEVLALNGCDVSDTGLSMLGSGIAPLSSISLRGCVRVTDDGVAALLAGSLASTLESIDLSAIPPLTDNATIAIVRGRMPVLEELRLRDCPLIGDTTVISLASAFLTDFDSGYGGTLRLLDLWNCHGVSAVALGWLKKPYFPKLRWLGLGWSVKPQKVVALAEVRPFLHIYTDGAELGHMFSGETEEIQPGRLPEEEDELERWIRDGTP
ncbi:hypothetical protein KC19_5G173300 [Ceratodon purpureus]|uniref:F-box/LRR-repeat protein 15-like leucin rich repeat domain-containing protein n=1 Tax=Ceratodon purpureus TaxID=3225 RepID=A0A8T0I3U1_CERPU|nr:hypothetical protein KC19_5G173300 [Ceratodon purpureus]